MTFLEDKIDQSASTVVKSSQKYQHEQYTNISTTQNLQPPLSFKCRLWIQYKCNANTG